MTTSEDRMMRLVRFGFGATVGFLVGLVPAAVVLESFGLALLFAVLAGLIVGLLLMIFGRDFWETVGSWLSPW